MQTIRLNEKMRQALRLDRAVRFVWQAAPGWTVASLALLVLQGVLPLLALYLMKLIVDAVTFSLGAPDKMGAFQHVAVFIGLAAAVAVLTVVLQQISGLVKETQSLKVTDYMYDILHSKSIELDLEYYENSRFFDTLHRAQKEGPYRPTRIINGLSQMGQSGISLFAMVALLFSFHWVVGLGPLCSGGSRSVGALEIFRKDIQLATRAHPSGAKSQLFQLDSDWWTSRKGNPPVQYRKSAKRAIQCPSAATAE